MTNEIFETHFEVHCWNWSTNLENAVTVTMLGWLPKKIMWNHLLLKTCLSVLAALGSVFLKHKGTILYFQINFPALFFFWMWWGQLSKSCSHNTDTPWCDKYVGIQGFSSENNFWKTQDYTMATTSWTQGKISHYFCNMKILSRKKFLLFHMTNINLAQKMSTEDFVYLMLLMICIPYGHLLKLCSNRLLKTIMAGGTGTAVGLILIGPQGMVHSLVTIIINYAVIKAVGPR